jgi:hypothetical protein
MMKFTINPDYLTSITIHIDHIKSLPEDEQLIAKLKGHQFSSTRSKDHPEFAKLRERLGEEGFIKIERGWWNGDRVIKPFQLNAKKFKTGDKFCSASAIKWDLEH